MEESGLAQSILKRSIAVLLLVCGLGLSYATQASSAKQEEAEVKTDYALVQQDIVKFEGEVNEVIGSTFSSSAFAIVQRTKGAYLQGYGVSFAFLINIHQAMINTPFGKARKRADLSPAVKKQRIEDLKEKLVRLLQDSGNSIQQLRKTDRVTIIAYIEDRNFPGEPNANKTIVLTALKKDLDELVNKSDRLKEFKQRIKIVEY